MAIVDGDITCQMPLKKDLEFLKGVGPATFSRASDATYISPETGLITTASVDEARFEKEGLLMEGESTNLVTYSEDFSDPSWLKFGTALVGSTTAPDNSSSANELQSAGSGSSILAAINVGSAGIECTASFFLKEGTSDRCSVALLNGSQLPLAQADITWNSGSTPTVNFSSGSGDFEELANGWIRVWVRGTTQDSFAVPAAYPVGNDTGGTPAQTTFVWGAQIEEQLAATSYIPTEGSAVSRAAENLSILKENWAGLTHDVPASVSISFRTKISGLKQSIVAATGFGDIAAIKQIAISLSAVDASLWNFNSITSGTTISPDTDYRLLIKGENNSVTGNTAVNGVFPLADRLTGNQAGAVDKVRIGTSNSSLAEPFYGHLSNLRIYNRTLTAEEVGSELSVDEEAISSARYKALTNIGYEGSVDDMLYAYWRDNSQLFGASVGDMQAKAVADKGYDSWYSYLGSVTSASTLNERELEYWQSGGIFA